jgi:hypothetical protein
MHYSHNPNNRLKPAVEKPPHSQWDSLSLDTWMWEIASLAFSTLCFAAILALLLAYNDKPWPELPHGLTLNAIVSVLATETLAYEKRQTLESGLTSLSWIPCASLGIARGLHSALLGSAVSAKTSRPLRRSRVASCHSMRPSSTLRRKHVG